MPSLSIVIPVYNIEMYLNECVDSILNQQFDDLEIILVDDGSTDKSGRICDEYASNDKRISVIHKANGGVSSARNEGIKKACGEYLWFFDGDDVVPKGCLQNIMPFIIKHAPDICVCALNLSLDNMETISPLEFKFTPDIDKSNDFLVVMSDLYENADCVWSASRSIYNRDFVVRSGVLFDTSLRCCEDCEFHMNIFQWAKRFYLTQVPILNYRMNRKNSLSTVRDKVFSENTIRVYAKWIDFFSKAPYKKHGMVIVRKLAKRFYAEILDSFYLEDKKERDEIFLLIKKNRFVYKYIQGIKRKTFSLFYAIFGLELGRLLYHSMHPCRSEGSNEAKYEISD